MKDLYVKTLLYAYPNVRKIINRIDEVVKKKALSSMTDCSDCQEQCEKIVRLTVQKGVLFEINYYLEKILSRLFEEEKLYLEYKYFKTKTKDELKGVDLSSRNYFRKQQKLFEHISNCFIWLNLADSWFEECLKKVPYLKKLLQSVILHQNANASGSKKVKEKKEDVA